MADVAIERDTAAAPRTVRKRASLQTALKRKSTAAFLMTLPLILLILLLVIYPAFYSLHLATLNKSMQRFIGLGNFEFLFKRETFWLVVQQSCIFAITAVVFKALIGFIVAHFVHNIPAKGQRKWRGMLLVPWVIPPAMSTLAWLWLFDPSYSAFNYLLAGVGVDRIPWTGETGWARFSVILVNIWFGAPFFMIMYLAALKSVPDQLYEAAAIDGANWWQRIWYVTLPMMRNIIAITTLFSLIVTFANFDIVRILTAGGPLDRTHMFATWAFRIGIEGGDIPLGASVSLFMLPILAIAAVFILRDINKRGNEA
jgi:multiple sugar transport system permease protein